MSLPIGGSAVTRLPPLMHPKKASIESKILDLPELFFPIRTFSCPMPSKQTASMLLNRLIRTVSSFISSSFQTQVGVIPGSGPSRKTIRALRGSMRQYLLGQLPALVLVVVFPIKQAPAVLEKYQFQH